MTFYISAPTSLAVERSLISALETMGFEKDPENIEISDNEQLYELTVVVKQMD